MRLLSTLLKFACLVSSIDAARILGLFPKPAKSHFSCNLAIMKSLHAAGHTITMITPFPSDTMKAENFTIIDSRFDSLLLVGQSTIQDVETTLSDMNFLLDLETQYCYNFMKLSMIQEALNSKEKLYDVMFVELMRGYECFLPIAEKLGIPVIGTVTLRSWKVADYTIGMPNNPAVVPFELSTTAKPDMNFVERVRNLWNNLVIDYRFKPRMRKVTYEFYRKYFDEDLLYKKDISMIFYNNHPALLPRPLPPNAIEIGGVHLTPAKPLPEKLQKFIDEAPHGVILFSLGSLIKGSSISSQQRNAFLEAFRSIPQRVIWKFEEGIKNLPENVLLLDWLPQRDILEHKNLVAFMSHCGQSGVYEAIITGTPVITVPIYCDGPSNAALLLHRGVGVNLDLKTVTPKKILTALNTIINDTTYYQRMQELSRVFKDRPMTPQELIVYWTEYVVRHNGAPYLKVLGVDMPLYKYLMLDIIASLLIIASVATFVIYAVTRKLLTLIKREPKTSLTFKKNK